MTAPSPAAAQGPSGKPLTAKEKRAAREEARRAVVRAEQERIAAARAREATGTPAAAESAAPAPLAPPPDRTDKDRQRDAAAFLRGVLFPFLAVLAFFTPYRLDLDKFTPEAAEEDARAWVPLLARYRWLDLACTWAGAPARLAARVRELAVRKPPDAPPAAKVVA